MWSDTWSWLRLRYRAVITSIAFFPMLIMLAFMAGGFALLLLDRSGWGMDLKRAHTWLSLKDAEAARTIVATVAAGVLSLAVFSFSMVMVVLNQAAAQLSNRTLDELIGDRFQQTVLGLYIGTIVHALALLTIIRQGEVDAALPSLSIYGLIIATVLDIFLFIYFLHFITRAVKYEVIIERIRARTEKAMNGTLPRTEPVVLEARAPLPFVVRATSSGVFEGFSASAMMRFCRSHAIRVEFDELPGSYVLRGAPLLRTDRPVTGQELEGLLHLVPLSHSASIDGHYSFGFRELTEVAMKALSPGLNDPGTALLSLHSLFRLFLVRLERHPELQLKDDNGELRVLRREWPFELLFASTIRSIWDYGKGDRSIRHELRQLLLQLPAHPPAVSALLEEVEAVIAADRDRPLAPTP